MDVGLLLIFQNYQGRRSDAEMVRDQMHLALQAEPLGYDAVWPPEHHFTDYSACPDNVQFLSWLAGRTTKLKLATGAVIVPWNDPLRVVEKMAFLDHLSGGRAVLGLGRGLARVEYQHFGIEMASSRDRFDEAARMIVDGLEKGFVEGAGPYYPQVRTEVRPRPLRSFRERLMVFSQQPWEMFAQGTLATYRAHWSKLQQGPAPAPLTGDLMFCHEDAAEAERLALEYMSNYYLSIIHHYELLGHHLEGVKGYELYNDAAQALRAVGAESSAKIYCGIQTWGTPEQILDKLRARKALLGDFDLALIAHYGGMPVELAEQSIRLFATRVLPQLKG